jgi:hypothetical protein
MGSIPRPFVVVHSGKTQMMRVGNCFVRSAREWSLAVGGGDSAGGEKARRMARKRVMCSTRRVEG